MAAKQRRWRIDVEGAEELAAMFEGMADDAKNILEEASKAGAEIVLEAAKRNCPVRTGKLKNSLAIKKEKTKKDTRGVYRVYTKGVKEGGVRYGFFVEAGTKRTAAQPFLRPALDENKDNIKDVINETIVKNMRS